VSGSGDIVLNGRGVAWWHDERGAPVVHPSRPAQLRSLLALLDCAIEAQPLADEIVAACGDAGEVPPALVRAGARLQITFYRLRRDLEDLDLDGELEEVRERGGSYLLYHQWMLREALATAFSPRLTDRDRLKCRINGLGAPADRLRALRNQVAGTARSSIA
jgi:hypothetical protein